MEHSRHTLLTVLVFAASLFLITASGCGGEDIGSSGGLTGGSSGGGTTGGTSGGTSGGTTGGTSGGTTGGTTGGVTGGTTGGTTGGSTGGTTGGTGGSNGTIDSNFFTFLQRNLSSRQSLAEPFTVSGTTTFIFRCVGQYSGSMAIVTPDTVQSFVNFGAYSGYAIHRDSSGHQSVTLGPGTYYLGMRNTSNSSNTMRIELDLQKHTTNLNFIDYYVSGVKSLASGGKLWQGFTVQDGVRYFIDGCNTGLEIYVVNESQLSAFQNGGSFQYYTDYSFPSPTEDQPGGAEYRLPAGNYYLCFRNTSGAAQSLDYLMERYNATSKPVKLSKPTPDSSGRLLEPLTEAKLERRPAE
ncbi:MAG: hypothetical protein JST30_01820 [Armatimonadetes bacterium]|nr:hypothetical protein [Armatimonadota bacterium]